MTNPTVSVCIPAYNHEKYVAEAIESVLDQSFQDFEIVVTDDGSTDRTMEVIEGFKDPRICLFRHPANLGPSMAANNNMRAARGKYLAFLPSDDAFLPGKLERQVAFLERNPEVHAVFGHISVVDEDGDRLTDPRNFYAKLAQQPNRTRAQWLRHFFFNGNCLFGSTAMIRKDLVREIGLHDPRLLQLQDLDYWIRICLRHDIHILQEAATRFRVRSGSANTSAGKPEVHTRALWEFQKVLRHYRAVEQLDFFREIFPDLAESTDRRSRLLALGQLAAGGAYAGLQLFGLDLIYEVLGEESKEDGASPGLAYQDFFRLTGSLDLYNIDALEKARAEVNRLRAELSELSASTNRDPSALQLVPNRAGD